MLDRIRGHQNPFNTCASRPARRTRRGSKCKIQPEILEGRQLLTASLASISDLTVPAQTGYQQPLDGSGSTGSSQTYTVSSSNPDIAATVADGPFLSLGVSHTASSSSDVTFSGTLTFQLFNDLTSNTVSQIEQFVADGYYVGKDFTRIMNGFPGISDYVAQGGALNANGSGNSGQPGTPFANQPVQQLAFTGPGQLAMANAGGTATNDTQFFVTTGKPAFLDYNYTIFGQMVSGQSVLANMTKVSVHANPLSGEVSSPVNPITITSASISDTNVDGVIHIDTTQAKAGETAVITVTATDPSDGSQVSRSFNVVVSSYNGPSSPAVNFRPFANATTANVVENTPKTLSLAGTSGNPTASSTESLSYTLLSQPEHGTITNFNASTGAFIYTPNSGYLGTDTFQYQVQSTNSAKGPVTTSNAGTATITVSESATTSLPESAPIPTTDQIPAVSMDRVDLVENKRNQVVKVVAHFTGSLNSTQAGRRNFYRLATPNRYGAFSARTLGTIQIARAAYSDSDHTVTLSLARPLTLKKPIQLLVRGTSPTGLEDSEGRFIDGAQSGQTGTNAVAIISMNGVAISHS